jgi:hypothetical protein
MKALGVVVNEKSQSNQIGAGRIHYQAFTRWLVTGFPERQSKRIRINCRGARALLIDMG